MPYETPKPSDVSKVAKNFINKFERTGTGTTEFYSPIAENWYQSLPYAFLATDSSGNKTIFNLPINPNNISVSTHFATNVIATIGGTVEEHAPQRYFDIAIQGTTGIAPKYTKEGSAPPEPSQGRTSYTPLFSVSSMTGGFFAKTAGQLDNALNKARDILGGAKKHESGISPEQSGYWAFHQFYLFLMKNKASLSNGAANAGSTPGGFNATNAANKALAASGSNLRVPGSGSGGGQPAPLKFVSYKDNQEYTCAVTRFEMARSVDNPMMYNYSIQLRAYKLTSINSEKASPTDRLIALGLAGETSMLSQFKNKISSAKAGISAVGGAIKTFGR